MEIWQYLIGSIIMVLLLNLVTTVALHFPDAPWVKLFFRTKFGPRTDVKYMTRNDLFWSAWMFMVYAAIFMVIFVGIWLIFAKRSTKGESLSLWTTLTVVLLSFVVCTISACCLLVAALFRKKDYVPPNSEEQIIQKQEKQ